MNFKLISLLAFFGTIATGQAALRGDSTVVDDAPEELLVDSDVMDEEDTHDQAERDLQHVYNPRERNPTVADSVAMDPDLSTLYSLLEVCGLDDALDNRQAAYTLFAPTNHAFGLLDPAAVQTLLETREICNVLLYHVVQGRVTSGSRDRFWGGTLQTLHGESLTTETRRTRRGRVIKRVNGFSRLRYPNSNGRRTANGVVHVINQVLLPPS